MSGDLIEGVRLIMKILLSIIAGSVLTSMVWAFLLFDAIRDGVRDQTYEMATQAGSPLHDGACQDLQVSWLAKHLAEDLDLLEHTSDDLVCAINGQAAAKYSLIKVLQPDGHRLVRGVLARYEAISEQPNPCT